MQTMFCHVWQCMDLKKYSLDYGQRPENASMQYQATYGCCIANFCIKLET